MMRWWLAIRPRAMAVDNISVAGMDFTILPSNTLHVEWRDGQGEAEYDDRPALRENFGDVTFYAPLFQQFMTKLTGLTLKQSKKIQTDLIVELYTYKRQRPFHYNVAAGSYDWEATDEALAAMTARIASTQATANGQVVSLADQINANIVNPGNQVVSEHNAYTVVPANSNRDQFNALIAHLNNTVLGASTGDPSGGANTINNKLVGVPPYGLAADIAHSAQSFAGHGSVTATFTAVGLGAAGTIPWIPLSSATPVNLTMTELCSIVDGIVDRQQSLLGVRRSKTNVVNALTTVPAVIAYDVTAGWPT